MLFTIGDNPSTSSGKASQITSYQYNHALQRISKTVAGQTQNHNQTTQYLWHGGLLDVESQLDNQGNPQITKRYFYLNLRPVAVIEYAGSTNQQRQDASPSTQLYAIHSDHLGTPQVLSNAQQQVVWQAEYASFGQATVTAMQLKQGAESSRIESNSASNAYGLISTAQANTQQPSVPPKHFEFNLRFAGQYADTESGYHYNWHRYYDPATGRYLTPDPIGLQGGLNAYGYVGQNPLQGVDPDGRVWIDGSGNTISPEALGKVQIYIFHDNDFKEQAMVQYNLAVEKFGAGAVALSNTGSTTGFTTDWGNMQGAINQVMIMTHGKNQSINLGNGIDVQFTATGNNKTNKSGSYAPNIQDLPDPKGAVRNATLFMYSCHSADSQKEAHGDQGALSGSEKPIAQVFSETFGFKEVIGTAGSVNYYSLLTTGTGLLQEHYLKPYPENGKWIHYPRPINFGPVTPNNPGLGG